MDYDFAGLTLTQQRLLTFQGWCVEDAGRIPQPSKRTVKKLLERGLVVEHINQGRIFSVREYEVPIPVHMAWCQHCADRV